MNKNNRGFIFLCSRKTQDDCLKHMLMGGRAGYVKKDQVQVGDSIFLYNYQSEMLKGEFIAISNSDDNINSDAWNGDYPSQVKVEWDKKYEDLSSFDIEKFLRFDKDRKYPQKFLTAESLKKLEERYENPIRAERELIDYRIKNPGTLMTDDGHKVRSEAERTIDNWLYHHDVVHAYELELPNSANWCDFYIPGKGDTGTYIEYWGLDNEKYLKNKGEKEKIYADQKLQLIELSLQDLNNISLLLTERLVNIVD